jgi:hypothetical protein
MTFNDRRALDLLLGRITALEARITELNAVLADPGLYRATPHGSATQRRRSRWPKTNWRQPKSSGNGWGCCGKKSKGSSLGLK